MPAFDLKYLTRNQLVDAWHGAHTRWAQAKRDEEVLHAEIQRRNIKINAADKERSGPLNGRTS